MRRKLGFILLILILAMPLLSFLSACAYTAPFRRVEPVPDNLKTAVVTLSAVESQPGQRKAFFADTQRVLSSLRNQPGLLGYSFRFQFLGRKAWTMTAWKDIASRDRFAASPLHHAAVKNSRGHRPKQAFHHCRAVDLRFAHEMNRSPTPARLRSHL